MAWSAAFHSSHSLQDIWPEDQLPHGGFAELGSVLNDPEKKTDIRSGAGLLQKIRNRDQLGPGIQGDACRPRDQLRNQAIFPAL